MTTLIRAQAVAFRLIVAADSVSGAVGVGANMGQDQWLLCA